MGLLLLLAACTPAQPPAAAPDGGSGATAQADKLTVVATFSILGDLVANVGGDKITVTSLVGAGGDAHTFEPTPADTIQLLEAKLIFENGLEFEPWLDDLYTASQSQAQRVVVSALVEAHTIAAHAAGEAQTQTEVHDQQEHSEFDPHIWHSVENAKRMVETIGAALVAADAANAASYQANVASYLKQLDELDEWIRCEIALIPQERHKLVTGHDTFAYFAEHYGFEVIGSALASASTEAADPAAADMAALIEQIRAAGAPAIFAENVANSAIMEKIAAEAGVTLAPPLYSDALGEPGSAGDSYIKMMRFNVTTIVKALTGQ